jgi:hypothetical protein
VSVAAQDAAVDAKEEPDGHHQTEIETRKIRSQNPGSGETLGEGTRISPIKASAVR